jgi:hypothetical protein
MSASYRLNKQSMLSKSAPTRRKGHQPTGRGLVTTHPRDGCVATSKKVCVSGVNERILDKLPGKDLLRSCSRSGQALVSTPRRALDPRDREAATRGGEILGLHKAILVASAAVALWVVLFTAPSR